MTKRRVGLVLCVLAMIVGACGSDASDAAGPPGASPDAAPDDGDGPGLAVPPPVDGEGRPSGVFVSSSYGDDHADASMLRPLKSLAVAIRVAQAQGNRPVIACAEPFSEALVLTEGISVYGSFDCSDRSLWKQDKARRAQLVSPTSPAVIAQGLVAAIRFEGFDIQAPDMPGVASPQVPALSSYGMIIKDSTSLMLAELTVRAGKGQDGAEGAEPASGNAELTPAATRGAGASSQGPCVVGRFSLCDAVFVEGSAGGTSRCQLGANGSPGGRGGNGPVSDNGVYRVAVTASATGRPPSATSTTAVGGTVGTIGLNQGANGQAGAPGTLGEHGRWSFHDEGYIPGDGTAGGMGLPGRGGGGGAGTTRFWASRTAGLTMPPFEGIHYGAAGAGGGAGGCGGVPGAGGVGGGASVGLFIVNSEVSLKTMTVAGGKGGRGGKGALGTEGTPGSGGGAGIWSGAQDTRPDRLYGAAGGNGGAGGAAGLSGHGAPGLSVALVVRGARPKSTDLTLVPGTGGDGFAAIVRQGQTLPAIRGESKAEHFF